MLVRLLKDVLEEGRLKASIHENRPSVAFVKGAVVEMSEASAKKYIEKGLAEPYIQEEQSSVSN